MATYLAASRLHILRYRRLDPSYSVGKRFDEVDDARTSFVGLCQHEVNAEKFLDIIDGETRFDIRDDRFQPDTFPDVRVEVVGDRLDHFVRARFHPSPSNAAADIPK